jgi:EAL and modified HD-GYP domain-containing signal transduction protein
VAVHVGQQVIVDAKGRPHGYELLFRSSAGAAGAGSFDGDAATAQVLVATFLEFGLQDLVGDRLAFINVPRAFLVGQLPLPFPPGQVVLEVLEDVDPDAEVLAGIEQLSAAGHLIALDDVTAERDRGELLHLADYVKVDLLSTDPATLPELVRRSVGEGRRIVAEKVETREQQDLCTDLGVELFQGHLLGRARTLTQHSLSPSQLTCLRLVALLADPDARTRTVVGAVEADPGLTLKVLQAAGSAAVGLSRPPATVRDAVVTVGRESLMGWATLLSRGPRGSAIPVAGALGRGRMCQLIAESRPGPPIDPSAAFLTGLLSGLAVALAVPMDELLDALPLAFPVRRALLVGDGPLAGVLHTVLAYEHGSGPEVLDADQTRAAFLSALAWTSSLRRAIGQ